MEFLYLLSSVVGLIAVICFFVLCSNVGKIRRRLESNPLTQSDWINLHNKKKFLGKKEEALSALQEAFYLDVVSINELNAEDSLKEERYNKLKEKYESAFSKMGYVFPEREKRLKQISE